MLGVALGYGWRRRHQILGCHDGLISAEHIPIRGLDRFPHRTAGFSMGTMLASGWSRFTR